jgi:hypothetical protein
MDASTKSTNTPNILPSLPTQARKVNNPDHLKDFLERAKFSVDSIKVTSRPMPSYVSGASQPDNPSQSTIANTNFEHSVALNSKSPTTPDSTSSTSTDAKTKRANFKEAIQQKAIEGKGKPKYTRLLSSSLHLLPSPSLIITSIAY